MKKFISFLVPLALAGCVTQKDPGAWVNPVLVTEHLPAAISEEPASPPAPPPLTSVVIVEQTTPIVLDEPKVVVTEIQPSEEIIRPLPPSPEVEEQAALSFDTILHAQVALDRLNFSPGCMDGKLGGQTQSALAAWKSAPPAASGASDTELILRLATVRSPVIEHTVTPEDHAGLGPVPSDWPARAAMAKMDHSTVQERLAEQAHCTEALLARLNPTAAWPNPEVGTVLQIPNPGRMKIERAGRVEINQEQKTVSVFDPASNLIAFFPCSIAARFESRPQGEAAVKNQAENPNYTYDPKVFPELSPEKRGTKRLVIPPGPNNPVGLAWVGLTLPGYGVHGTPEPERIGNAESHGCIRLANWNAVKFAHMVRVGVPVVFTGP